MDEMIPADEHEREVARELDRWLAGDHSRRHVLAALLGVGAAGAVLPATARAANRSGFVARMQDRLLQQAAVELAAPDTPLGKAQAESITASTKTPADGSAFRAVAAAKGKYNNVSLALTYEAGLQALEPRNFSGPLWEQLTGMHSSVVELAHPDLYSKAITEHIARSGAYDVLDIEPAWIPSLANGGVIAPIDDYVKKYMNEADLNDYHPLYKFMPMYKGKRWGFFDDGDQLELYYRTDIFGDPKLASAYQAKYKQPFRVPATWDEYDQVAQFITDQLQPKIYGAVHFRKFGSPGNQFAFCQAFRANGGLFFDPKTMHAQLASEAGIRTLQQMIAANKASVPGNDDLDAVAAWVAWLTGKSAMLFSWPPTGRMSENYSQRSKAINFVPQSKIAGKVGYAIMPGKYGEMASGFVKAISADSRNPEAVFLFAQWQSSPPVSLVRVMLPYTLRDPYRISQYTSPLYRSLWPAAKDYLLNLSNAANFGVTDMIMPGWQDYALTLDRMCTAVWAGKAPKVALEGAAVEWNSTTRKIGVEAQRAAYQEFLKLPGCYPDHTIDAMGLAVHLS